MSTDLGDRGQERSNQDLYENVTHIKAKIPADSPPSLRHFTFPRVRVSNSDEASESQAVVTITDTDTDTPSFVQTLPVADNALLPTELIDRLEQHMPLIVIDVRSLDEYLDRRIWHSINVNLPTLLVKRFRRGNMSNFSLESFISTDAGRTEFRRVQQMGEQSKVNQKNSHGLSNDNPSLSLKPNASVVTTETSDQITGIGLTAKSGSLLSIQTSTNYLNMDIVIVDDDMDRKIHDKPGWTLFGVLELVRGDYPHGSLSWLYGGFRALEKLPKAANWIVKGEDEILDESTSSIDIRPMFSVDTERKSTNDMCNSAQKNLIVPERLSTSTLTNHDYSKSKSAPPRATEFPSSTAINEQPRPITPRSHSICPKKASKPKLKKIDTSSGTGKVNSFQPNSESRRLPKVPPIITSVSHYSGSTTKRPPQPPALVIQRVSRDEKKGIRRESSMDRNRTRSNRSALTVSGHKKSSSMQVIRHVYGQEMVKTRSTTGLKLGLKSKKPSPSQMTGTDPSLSVLPLTASTPSTATSTAMVAAPSVTTTPISTEIETATSKSNVKEVGTETAIFIKSSAITFPTQPNNIEKSSSSKDVIEETSSMKPTVPSHHRTTSAFPGTLGCPAAQPTSPVPITPAPTTHPEMAFSISAIIPGFFYLGPEPANNNHLEQLEALGIKRVLNMAEEVNGTVVEEWCREGREDHKADMQYLKCGLNDQVEATGVEAAMDKAMVFLDAARAGGRIGEITIKKEEDIINKGEQELKSKGKESLLTLSQIQSLRPPCPVYVHCRAGKSRSVMIALAYLIHANKWPLSRAYAYVTDRRKGSLINIGFVSELMRFEERELGKKSLGVVGAPRTITESTDYAENEEEKAKTGHRVMIENNASRSNHEENNVTEES